MTRGLVLFLAATVATAATGLATVAGEASDFGEDFLTPEERRKRELERKRGARPVLVCAPGALHAAVREGESVDVGFTIRNAGGRILRWAVTTAPEWARFDSRSGELGFGEARKLFVTFSAAGLGEGPVAGRIVIEAEGAGGSPMALGAKLTVGPALEGRSPEDRRPARAVEPAGPWTVRAARADVGIDVVVSTASFPGEEGSWSTEGLSIKGSYGIDLGVAGLNFDVDWGISRWDPSLGIDLYEHELVRTSGGVRGTFRMGERVLGHVSAGYGRFDYDNPANPVSGRGAGPFAGVGLSYELGRRASLHVEWRTYRWDGEVSDGISRETMRIDANATEMGLAVHF